MRAEAALDAALRRDRLIVAAGLVVLTLLAWAHVASGSGTGMSAWHMTSLALFPPHGFARRAGRAVERGDLGSHGRHVVGYTSGREGRLVGVAGLRDV